MNNVPSHIHSTSFINLRFGSAPPKVDAIQERTPFISVQVMMKNTKIKSVNYILSEADNLTFIIKSFETTAHVFFI